jgi:hypothetical protein
MITKETLARLLHEEFERDHWGDVDPDLFRHVADPEPEDGNYDDVMSLRAVLERVAVRLNAGDGS